MVFQHVTAWVLWSSALQAKKLADSALGLGLFAPVVQECPKRGASDEMRLLTGEQLKPVTAPVLHGVFVYAKKRRSLVVGIGAIDFDAPPIKALCRHDSKRAFVDELTNIFNAPSGRSWAELDRLGKAPRFNAGPPGGFADGNGTPWREN